MKSRSSLLLIFFLMPVVLFAPRLFADKLQFKDGTSIEGIVQKVEKGEITVAVGKETKVFQVLEIATMEFDTPHLPQGTPRLPLEHFLANMEAQEMVQHVEAVEKSAGEVRKLINRTRKEWASRKSIPLDEIPQWETARERFRAPLSRYQEVLNDIYFHILGKVDEYNQLMQEADEIYVGVKGPFSVGSSLIPKEMEKLPLKKYVPANWYDTIYFEGYHIGYNEAYEKYRNDPF